MLAALANALLLTPDERMHVLMAAKSTSGASLVPCPSSRPLSREVRPTVQAVLDRLEPTPAVLCNATDVLAHTATYGLLARPLGILDGESRHRVTRPGPRGRPPGIACVRPMESV